HAHLIDRRTNLDCSRNRESYETGNSQRNALRPTSALETTTLWPTLLRGRGYVGGRYLPGSGLGGGGCGIRLGVRDRADHLDNSERHKRDPDEPPEHE